MRAATLTILDSVFNNVPKGRNSLVSVRAALDKKDGSGTMGGKIGWIQTWNNNQDKLGEDDDADCIAYVTITWVGGERYAWLGDFGRVCGLPWYPSNVYVDNGKRIHFPTFAHEPNKPYSKNPKSYCGIQGFLGYRDLQMRRPVPVPNNRKKAIGPQRRYTSGTRVVVTKEAGYNTTELCTSETSWDPDFVSLDEGLYCDMDSRELWPVCDEDKDAVPCFDAEAMKVECGDKVERDAIPQQKEFTDIIQW
ncbi:Hypothetical protein NCS54_01065200 [Fusarium falciforme]|uniref:Hypothetical protein n=1 Tax=Fusarium falciforme TaxID=195108 RepID=UPI002300A62F|nr:Hypothetical protein NCS54_01065200 [Fusarium falciforme]WAO93118.1 Hypothetical protein NCS54_01065200 [Fusarium falciforme]